MKRRIALLVALMMLFSLASAAEPKAEAFFPWRSYTLSVSYMADEPITGDSAARYVVLRFDSADAGEEIAYADLNENASQFVLRDALNNTYPMNAWRFQGAAIDDSLNFTPPEAVSGFELLFVVPNEYETKSLTLLTPTGVEGENIINRLSDLRQVEFDASGVLRVVGESMPADTGADDLLPESALPTPDPFTLKMQASKAALRELDNPLFAQTYDYLASGETLGSGSKGDPAEGLQQILRDIGANIAVDGNIGGKTMEALNAARATLGIGEEAIDAVSLDDFKDFLFYAMLAKDSETAFDLYQDVYEEGALDYAEAILYLQKGNNYRAWQAFADLGDYADSAERAASCVLDWPENGEVYRNAEYDGSSTELTIETDKADDRATCVKIYAENDDLVSVIFIAGDDRATVKLPAGTYTMKSGVGSVWYGPLDAFGDAEDAYYNQLTFGIDDYSVALERNYSYTLTLEASETSGGDSVGSEYESWGNF